MASMRGTELSVILYILYGNEVCCNRNGQHKVERYHESENLV